MNRSRRMSGHIRWSFWQVFPQSICQTLVLDEEILVDALGQWDFISKARKPLQPWNSFFRPTVCNFLLGPVTSWALLYQSESPYLYWKMMRLKKLKIDQDDLSFTFHISLCRLISQNPEKMNGLYLQRSVTLYSV